MKALWIVHWPGKDTPACEEHMRKLLAVGDAMGFSVSHTPCEIESECANCRNEERRDTNSA